LLRCSPGEDATNGFFVACFIRVGSSTTVQTNRVAAAQSKRRKCLRDEAVELLELHAKPEEGIEPRKRQRKGTKKSDLLEANAEEWNGIDG